MGFKLLNSVKMLFVFGTRPEAIKCAPLIKEFQRSGETFKVKVCVTGQHREMLDDVLNFFRIKPDFDLYVMQPGQSLFDVISKSLSGLENVLCENDFKIIFVQGDTTTALAGALSGYYKKIEVAHVEAGLRSGNKFMPFPEEKNRILIGHLSDYHFAPTEKARENLRQEGIKKNVFVVGNTVIDALFLTLSIIKSHGEKIYYDFFDFLDFSKKILLVTGHRRESFGKPLENICRALKEIARKHNDVEIVYPVHLNPHVKKTVSKILKKISNVHLTTPLSYPHFIWIMSKAYLVLTDSGGVQEEAPSLGKPVLVMRNVTERKEGIEAGTAQLVGTDKNMIVDCTRQLLIDAQKYKKIAKAVNPYGTGKTSKDIVEVIRGSLFSNVTV